MKNMGIIKKLKKKKAFTLVELVGVLVIIGILNIVLIPVVSNSLKNSKQKLYDKQIDTIIMAAKAFASDYTYVLPEENETVNINLGQLKDTGYIEKEVKNPIDNNSFSECMLIKITNNAGNYDYEVNDENVPESCDRSSSVAISNPSKSFIKNNSTASYIITVSNNSYLFINYNIDKSKITLNTDTDAQYNIIGENGIYKLTIYSGIEQGEVAFVLNEGAITDELGNSVVRGQLPSIKILVDTSAPTIVFGTNGNSTYQKSQSSTITVIDNFGDTSSYKYIYSTNNNATPENPFTSGESYSQSSGDGDYYLIATACDQAGNCTTEKSNVFKLDNTAPSVPTITLTKSDGSGYDQTWTNQNVTQHQSSSDAGVGGVYYQYGHDNAYFTSMPNDWVISWDGNWTFYVRACDSLGNCSSSAPSYWIGRDATAPVIAGIGMTDDYSQGIRQKRVTLSISESGSGFKEVSGGEYQHSQYSGVGSLGLWNNDANGIWHNFGYASNSNNEVWIAGFNVYDNAGNSTQYCYVCSYSNNSCRNC